MTDNHPFKHYYDPNKKVAFNVQQLAEASGTSTDQIYTLIKTKQLRASKVGARWIISAAAVKGFLNSEEHASLRSRP